MWLRYNLFYDVKKIIMKFFQFHDLPEIEIKKRIEYWQKYHPDLNPNDAEAETNFKEHPKHMKY